MAKYGMPYKGSKDKIADKILSVLPDAECFVDLFGGGGAMAHAAALSGKYKRVIYNEFDPLIFKAFKMACDGEFTNERRWISHQEFKELKDSDPYAAICFSFGNDSKTYAYSPEIERFKKHLHYMFFAETPKAARLHWRAFVNEFAIVKREIEVLTQQALELCEKCNVTPIYNADGTLDAKALKKHINTALASDIRTYLRNALSHSGLKQADVDRHLGNQMSGHYFGASQWMLPTEEHYLRMREIIPELTIPWNELKEELLNLSKLESLQSLQSLRSLESLQMLESLERLERLQSLESLQIERTNLSYELVKIPDNSVVYCDPPYRGTNEYRIRFDHEAFFKWATANKNILFISEYQMPEGFNEVANFERRSLLSSKSRAQVNEKLYCNKVYVAESQLKL